MTIDNTITQTPAIGIFLYKIWLLRWIATTRFDPCWNGKATVYLRSHAWVIVSSCHVTNPFVPNNNLKHKHTLSGCSSASSTSSSRNCWDETTREVPPPRPYCFHKEWGDCCCEVFLQLIQVRPIDFSTELKRITILEHHTYNEVYSKYYHRLHVPHHRHPLYYMYIFTLPLWVSKSIRI